MFRKPTRPSLPLRKAPPLTTSPLSSGAREKTALLGARNRYAIRLADHQRSTPGFAGWDRLNHYLSFYPIVLMKDTPFWFSIILAALVLLIVIIVE